MFDKYIHQIAGYIDTLEQKGRIISKVDCQTSRQGLREGMPVVAIGPGANPGIILRSDTFVELGNPEAGSCAFVVWTKDSHLINDGLITIVGPDIRESQGNSLPFGQVLMVAGEQLDVSEYEDLVNSQYVADQIEGYMVRSSSRNIWSRLSHDAANKGFSLETLGSALMLLYKECHIHIQAMEILFVTSHKDDIKQLETIGSKVQETGREIIKTVWKERGYDLDCDLDCSSCDDQVICDEVKRMWHNP